MRWMNKLLAVMLIALLSFPTTLLAHGTAEEHKREVLWTNILFYGAISLFVLLILLFFILKSKVNQLGNTKSQENRIRRTRLAKAVNALKWGSMAAFTAVVVSGLVMTGNQQDTEISGPMLLDEVSIHHAHGMSYTPDGNKIFFAVHDGLRVYEDGQWILPAGEKHDYMGFSMVNDGFYSSGHPAPGSNKKNPLGIVKSTDEGESFETLALYGEIDFHGMSVGYESHVIYVFNPSPNEKMSETGLHYSTDEAKTWTKSEGNGLAGKPSVLAVHPTNPAVMAVGTDQGIFVTKDYGDQFETLEPSLEASAVFFNARGELYAAGLRPEPILVRMDAEMNVANEINIPVLKQDAISFIGQSPVNPKDISIMTNNNDVYVSADEGGSWTNIMKQGKAASTNTKDRPNLPS
ncbi:F510_1955 family glycosylhydrolase [Paenibacillus tarimensis]|uniref:F510_1955 family glycosylhydrolase n=1 Tax=Paenibacillus tarimensis TaxID=416012 RepID=UPI001F3F0598|nr:hypothetical protein [Paenibacillus tarimensis]MCF2943447.1 hypothetical protein [Paenibacillus tarimensis]